MDSIFTLLPIVLIALVIALPVWALIDVIRRSGSNQHKITWVLVVFFLGVFGALAYLIAGRTGSR